MECIGLTGGIIAGFKDFLRVWNGILYVLLENSDCGLKSARASTKYSQAAHQRPPISQKYFRPS